MAEWRFLFRLLEPNQDWHNKKKGTQIKRPFVDGYT